MGGCTFGLLLAFGGVAVGGLAVGGVAIGGRTQGGVSIGLSAEGKTAMSAPSVTARKSVTGRRKWRLSRAT